VQPTLVHVGSENDDGLSAFALTAGREKGWHTSSARACRVRRRAPATGGRRAGSAGSRRRHSALCGGSGGRPHAGSGRRRSALRTGDGGRPRAGSLFAPEPEDGRVLSRGGVTALSSPEPEDAPRAGSPSSPRRSRRPPACWVAALPAPETEAACVMGHSALPRPEPEAACVLGQEERGRKEVAVGTRGQRQLGFGAWQLIGGRRRGLESCASGAAVPRSWVASV
jgi:hypothetical protein